MTDTVADVLSPAQQNLKAKALAAEYGFTLQGIALLPEDGLSPRAQSLAAWLENGFHGPLDYMQESSQTRQHVTQRLPWMRSVLVLGAFYEGLPRGVAGEDLVAHVAGYARGRDYHLIFQRRLKKLCAALVGSGVCRRTHWHSDTGPFLERAWGEAAGVGWSGKNACLIHPRLGSFFLLSEVFMDSTPEPDRPMPNYCGTCTRCLDACPTQAFPAPGVLDANRCLVTWNIERRGETPKELWAEQGAWAAGCDICQTVCPYNAPRRVSLPDAELAAPLPWQSMSLADCIRMDEATFDRAFPASALRRTGLKGLRLGAITAAGNLKLENCREALIKSLSDVDNDIRDRAAWALSTPGQAV